MKRQAAFSLIELVIAMAILSLLASMAAPLAETVIRRGKEQELKTALGDARIDKIHQPTRDEVVLEPWRADDFTIFAIDRVINKRSEQFRFLFASDVDNFTEFPQGFVLAEDGELRYTVEKPREAVVFPNANVAIGQRTVLLVVPTRLWE